MTLHPTPQLFFPSIFVDAESNRKHFLADDGKSVPNEMVQLSLADALMICFSPTLGASLLHLCVIITKLLPCSGVTFSLG